MKSKSHCVMKFFFFFKSQACLPTPKNKKFKMHLFFFLKALSYQVKLQSHQFLLTEIVFDYFVDIFSH